MHAADAARSAHRETRTGSVSAPAATSDAVTLILCTAVILHRSTLTALPPGADIPAVKYVNRSFRNNSLGYSPFPVPLTVTVSAERCRERAKREAPWMGREGAGSQGQVVGVETRREL